MTISALTKEWQNFYFALAGVTATLMGLLFVSLSLHANQIHDEENTHFLRLARLTFSNYLMLLVFALQMLVPMRHVLQLSIPTMAVSVIGLGWTIFLRIRGLEKTDPNAAFIRRTYTMSIFSYAMFFFIGLLAIDNTDTALYFALTPLMMLIISSVRNSWGLMMMLRTK